MTPSFLQGRRFQTGCSDFLKRALHHCTDFSVRARMKGYKALAGFFLERQARDVSSSSFHLPTVATCSGYPSCFIGVIPSSSFVGFPSSSVFVGSASTTFFTTTVISTTIVIALSPSDSSSHPERSSATTKTGHTRSQTSLVTSTSLSS